MKYLRTLFLLLISWLAAVRPALGQPVIVLALGATVTASTVTVDPAGDIYIWGELN